MKRRVSAAWEVGDGRVYFEALKPQVSKKSLSLVELRDVCLCTATTTEFPSHSIVLEKFVQCWAMVKKKFCTATIVARKIPLSATTQQIKLFSATNTMEKDLLRCGPCAVAH